MFYWHILLMKVQSCRSRTEKPGKNTADTNSGRKTGLHITNKPHEWKRVKLAIKSHKWGLHKLRFTNNDLLKTHVLT